MQFVRHTISADRGSSVMSAISPTRPDQVPNNSPNDARREAARSVKAMVALCKA